MSKHKEIEIVDLGEDFGEGLMADTSRRKPCKFVIVENDTFIFFVYGPVKRFPYHANLVDKFCSDYNIASYWSNHPDMVQILDGEHKVRGGGWLRFDPEENSLQLAGGSSAYGAFDGELARTVVSLHPRFRDRTITIG